MIRKLLFILLFPLTMWGQVQIGQDILGDVLFDHNGYSVDISSYGNVIAVGAPENSSNGAKAGQVRVFEIIEGDWIQIGQDILGLAAGDKCGFDVKLSRFGDILAVGSPFSAINGTNSGNVRVFEYKGGVWVQKGNTIEGKHVSEQSGFSISFSLDGNIIAIGAPYKDWNNNFQNPAGTARVFQYNHNSQTWVQIGQDINGQGFQYYSGSAVELSGDGRILAIGTPHEGVGGVVRVYENISGSWIQKGSSLYAMASADRFGRSLSLSADGSVLAVGAYVNSSVAYSAGHVRVFKYLSNNWQQIGSDIFGASFEESFGFGLSLSEDGKFLGVGGFRASLSRTEGGVFKVYANQGGVWTKLFSDINGMDKYEYLGYSVAVSGDGTRGVVGAPQFKFHKDHYGPGIVRVYDWSLLSNKSFENKVDFTIYPNPATNILNIRLDNDLSLEQITIFNNLGQKILTTNEVVINVENVASGLYFVEVKTNHGKATKKVIIK